MAVANEELLKDDVIEERDGAWYCKVCPPAKDGSRPKFESARGAGIHRASMHTARGKALRRRQSKRRREQAAASSNGNGNGHAAMSDLISIPFPEPVSRITIDSDRLLKGYSPKGKLVSAQILASEKK